MNCSQHRVQEFPIGLYSPEQAAERQQSVSRAEGLLARLLAIQCRRAGAISGALLRLDENGSAKVLAVHPPLQPGSAKAAWIQKAEAPGRQVMASGKSAVIPETVPSGPQGPVPQYLILIPLKSGKEIRAVAAFVVPARSRPKLLSAEERLKTTALLLDHLELKLTVEEHRQATRRLHLALDVVSVVNKSKHFLGAAMSLCNELAQRTGCSRVSLGFLEGRYVRLQAMSRTDTFRRQMKLIQDIEAAMEECFDQDVEILFPALPDASYVSRAAEKLSESHGPAAVLSMPVRQNGEGAAVMTLERPPDQPFNKIEEIEAVRLACDLCAPRLIELRENDRWFGARAASWSRKKLAALLGPQHTWMKVTALCIFLFAVFAVFAKGGYRIEAPFVFEASVQQSVVAPFDSFLKTVSVEPGDGVLADQTILGVLETSELRLKLAVLKAEQMGYAKQRASAMRDGKTAEAQIAEAQMAKVAAEIRLHDLHIEQATLVAPISGRIVSKDLKRQLGAPVKTGEVLFEIAGIEQLRAELYVPEESITQVHVGQQGQLASVGHPDQKIPFVVERVTPIAEVVNQENVFTVRATLLEKTPWMRPGMEGVAKISAGERRYVWIWSHRLTNWLRMKLWL